MIALYLSLIDTEENRIKFEDIYNKYINQMIAYSISILHNHHDAEDAVQDALLSISKMMNRISNFDERSTKAYVMTVVKNVSLNHLEKKKRSVKTVDIDVMYDLKDESALDEMMSFIDDDNAVAIVSKLKPIYRDVLLLYCIDDMSVKDIAISLNRKETTVKKQLTRAKQMLAKILIEEGYCAKRK